MTEPAEPGKKLSYPGVQNFLNGLSTRTPPVAVRFIPGKDENPGFDRTSKNRFFLWGGYDYRPENCPCI